MVRCVIYCGLILSSNLDGLKVLEEQVLILEKMFLNSSIIIINSNKFVELISWLWKVLLLHIKKILLLFFLPLIIVIDVEIKQPLWIWMNSWSLNIFSLILLREKVNQLLYLREHQIISFNFFMRIYF